MKSIYRATHVRYLGAQINDELKLLYAISLTNLKSMKTNIRIFLKHLSDCVESPYLTYVQ